MEIQSAENNKILDKIFQSKQFLDQSLPQVKSKMTGSYAGLGLASYTEPGKTKAQIMDALGVESFEILADSSSS